MDYSYSFGCAELISITVTALGGIPKELINHNHRL